jgi:hypothetical protein
VQTRALVAAAQADADEIERAHREGRPMPDITPPRI